MRKGWCNMHWLRWRRYGDPLAVKTPKGSLAKWVDETAVPYDGEDCLIWPFSGTGEGYGQLKYHGKRWIASRLVCQLVHGEPPRVDAEACHSCGNGHLGCMNPKHLRWGTRDDNMQDMIAHGNSIRGEKNRLSKLTEDDVKAIRELAKTSRQRSIAELYGVTEANVSQIVHRKTWAWVP
jgi:hypothetical protein